MRVAAAAALLLVAACSSTSVAARPSLSPSTAASASPAASPSATPSAAVTPASPSPSPSGRVTFNLPGLSAPPAVPSGACALPIFWGDPQSQNVDDAAFLVYPGRTVTAPQAISGGTGAYYDRAVGRWLPVDQSAVSPDGHFFAYADYDLPPSPAAGMAQEPGPRAAGALATTGRVELVNAQSGAIRILYSGSPTYAIAGFTGDGIYLRQVSITMDGDFSTGLYLLGLSGGKPAPVPGGNRTLDRGGWTVVNGAAFGTEFATGGGITSGNELVELDLHGAGAKVWLTKPEGTAVNLAGVDDQGRLLITAYASGYSTSDSPAPTPPSQLLAVVDPGQAAVLWQSADPTAQGPLGPAFAGPDSTWLGGTGAVWNVAGATVSRVTVPVNEYVSVGNSCLAGG